jgi:flagellar transcriptional activator FlhC
MAAQRLTGAAACRSVLGDVRGIERAAALIGMGARMQLLTSKTDMPHDRLVLFYLEVAGRGPRAVQRPAAVFDRLVPPVATQHSRVAIPWLA